jgi:hypothetical protein
MAPALSQGNPQPPCYARPMDQGELVVLAAMAVVGLGASAALVRYRQVPLPWVIGGAAAGLVLYLVLIGPDGLTEATGPIQLACFMGVGALMGGLQHLRWRTRWGAVRGATAPQPERARPFVPMPKHRGRRRRH